MANARDRIKLTGDTHLPETEADDEMQQPGPQARGSEREVNNRETTGSDRNDNMGD